ncbi:flagellar FlbD family protein [Priestia megaterium]|nr:flagellar FlbD family protein [Priestia megaterium]
MITLTRLNGKTFTLNALYIEQLESFPDTTITLTNNKKLVVKESVEEVNEKVSSYYKSINVLGLQRDTEG